MTFETWAKELLCRELISPGTVHYVRKPRDCQGWYCATPNGFLLHVEAAKESFGYFGINYEIMPLTGRVYEVEPGFLGDPIVSMGLKLSATTDCAIRSGFPFQHKIDFLRTKSIGECETNELVVEMIHNYLNPLFASLTSYESYCKSAIEAMLIPMVQSEAKRKALAEGLFHRTPGVAFFPPFYDHREYPPNFPWFTARINQMPCVYAFLGQYDDALVRIRDRRQKQLQSLESARARGSYANREEAYLAQRQYIETEDREIEVAMEEKNVARIQEILSENYQRNRQLIYERIGLEIPDEYDRIE